MKRQTAASVEVATMDGHLKDKHTTRLSSRSEQQRASVGTDVDT